MNASNGIGPPAAAIAARIRVARDRRSAAEGAGEVVEVAEAQHEAGQHAEHDRADAGDAERGRATGGGVTIGVASPSGTGFIHISRITPDVVRRGDRRC